MSMHQSIETGCLESVIESDPDSTRVRLRHYMTGPQLVRFAKQVTTLQELIFEEISRRGETDRVRPAADTGEINVIRGRE